MRRKLLVGILCVLILGWVAWSVNMGQYETPRYTVENASAPFELRRYEPMLAAEVETTGTRESAIQQGFRILAGFIFGDNVSRDKVAMTTPVTQQSSTIAMTSPVTQTSTGKEGVWRTRFMMPSKYTLENLPQPNDERITVLMTEPKLYAAVRFTWQPTSKRFAEFQSLLEAWLTQQNLEPVGSDPIFAIYNPPWTIPFLRRNEVWIEVAKK